MAKDAATVGREAPWLTGAPPPGPALSSAGPGGFEPRHGTTGVSTGHAPQAPRLFQSAARDGRHGPWGTAHPLGKRRPDSTGAIPAPVGGEYALGAATPTADANAQWITDSRRRRR